MNIADIDKNLAYTVISERDIRWINANKKPFSLHGVTYSAEEQCYRRMTKEVAEASDLSEGMPYLCYSTAGGRLRFQTDSPYVALKCVIPSRDIMEHMPMVGSFGFSIYSDGKYAGKYAPIWKNILNPIEGDVPRQGVYYTLNYGKVSFDGINYFLGTGMREIELHFPLYGGVFEFYVGVKEGAKILPPREYTYKKPVVFYGSSITQGGCASHSGNDYVALVSRWLDTDFLNLGFSGSAKAEKTIRDYLASLDPSIYVLDYDHNAPNAEYLQRTHYPLYQAIREKHPTTPIVFMSKPDCDYDPNANERRAVIYETYRKAQENGDTNVSFIDGKTLFGENDRDCCTVDKCHPNDLGFYRMAQVVYPVLMKYLMKED